MRKTINWLKSFIQPLPSNQTTTGLSLRASNGSISYLTNPTQWLVNALSGGRQTLSGETVSPSSALTVASHLACVRCIAEDISKLPLKVYEALEPRGRKLRRDHPLHRILFRRPNPFMSSMKLRETVQGWAVSWGNGYARIERRNGEVVALWPIHPSRVELIKNGSSILYRVFIDAIQTAGKEGSTLRYVNFDPSEIFHLFGLGDGYEGYSTVRLAAENMGVALAARNFGAAFFGNGTMIGGILKHPGLLDVEAHKRLISSWAEIHQGAKNAHKPAILEEGMTFEQMTIPPEDAQFLETKQFEVEEMCRFHRVPPHKIQHLLRATFTNIEHQSLEYVTDTMWPWTERWEQEIALKLIAESEQDIIFAKHNLVALIKGDTTARGEFYTKLFNMGALSPNDIRELEDMNPIEGKGGDDYYIQVNMTNIKSVGKNGEEINTTTQGRRKLGAPPSPGSSLFPFILDAARRIERKEEMALNNAMEKYQETEDIKVWCNKFYSLHANYMYEIFEPILESMGTEDYKTRSEKLLAICQEHVNQRRHIIVSNANQGWTTFANGFSFSLAKLIEKEVVSAQ